MTERPILFSGPMVRALLDGRKTRKRVYVRKGEDMNAPLHLARRLAGGIDAAPEGGCWLWKRTTNNAGYGTLTVGGRPMYAHRLALILSGVSLAEGQHAIHSCDTPPCINPKHLRAGSRSDNMQDAVLRGRLTPPIVSLAGTKNPACKLNPDDVRSIRTMLAGGESQLSVARHFRVSQGQVSNIAIGKNWRSVV